MQYFKSLMLTVTQCLLLTLMIVGVAVAQRTESAKLLASDAVADQNFGHSVYISGDWAIVGATGDDSQARDAGAVYVFAREATAGWKEVAKLVASDAGVDQGFGLQVSISGERALVSSVSAAYVFEYDGAWNQVARFDARNPFGGQASISGDQAVVTRGGCCASASAAYLLGRDGAGLWVDAGPLVESATIYAVGIDTDQVIVGGTADSAYVFERHESGLWTKVARLIGDGVDSGNFGYSVSISKGRAVVGAGLEDVGKPDAGAAYVFEQDEAGTWNRAGKLQASDVQAFDNFGISVSIDGNRLAIGANGESGYAGAAYVFERSQAGSWTEVTKLIASDRTADGVFGRSIAVSGDRVIVGSGAEKAYIFESVPVGTNVPDETPSEFALSQNYPNPFNPTTTISYDLPRMSEATLTVYDVLGREVRELASGAQPAGTYEVSFDATRLPSGIYFYRLTAGDYVETKRMVVVR